MCKLKKRPRQSQSTMFRIQMDQKSQWECASASSKIETIRAAMHDQTKLLTILKSLGVIAGNSTDISHNQIENIVSTLQMPGKIPQPSTRASKKKKRVWALLPDLAINKPSQVGWCSDIIAKKAKLDAIKSTNSTKQWVMEEHDNYLTGTLADELE